MGFRDDGRALSNMLVALILIVVAVLATVGIAAFIPVDIDRVPAFVAKVYSHSDNIVVRHVGGDPVDFRKLNIVIYSPEGDVMYSGNADRDSTNITKQEFYNDGFFESGEQIIIHVSSIPTGVYRLALMVSSGTILEESIYIVGKPMAKIAYVHYDAAGNDWHNLNDEYVVITNKGGAAVNLGGWSLRDEAGHVYTFPDFTLQPSQSVTVHTGCGTDTATDLYWCSWTPVWNNDGDTAYLYDADGNLVDSYSW